MNFETYFDDVIGVSVPYEETPKESIVLRFSENRFPYVVSKPLHKSQKVGQEPNTICIEVKPNRELFQKIFSFIPDVEVLSPSWLRFEIADKMQCNLQKYFSVHKDCTDNV